MRAISLFSGAGGMDVGFKKAGFDIVWANEIDKDACDTYEHNHPDTSIRRGNIMDKFDEVSNLKNIDVVFGGPPCQSFSVAGKMDPHDERRNLVFEFMRIVEVLQPDFFVMENVKALAVSSRWKDIRERLLKMAVSAGYENTQIIILNATEFNVPQKRERMFMIGTKKKMDLDLSQLLNKKKKKASFVGDILKKCGPVGSKKNPKTCNAKITLAKTPVLRQSAYAGMLFNGAGRPINTNHYANTLPASMGGNKTPIVDDNFLYKNNLNIIEKYHNHLLTGGIPGNLNIPQTLRRLTTVEAAAIQTFPKTYKFSGTDNSVYTQIGNAVPCNLAYAVADVLQKL